MKPVVESAQPLEGTIEYPFSILLVVCAVKPHTNENSETMKIVPDVCSILPYFQFHRFRDGNNITLI